MSNFTIAAVDAGNGNTNAIVRGGKGKFKTASIPSVRAKVSRQTLGLGKNFELDYKWFEVDGQRYAVGDDAIKYFPTALDRHRGKARYGDKHHQFLTAYALAMCGVKNGLVDLTLMCPPAYYADNKNALIDNYQGKTVEAIMNGDTTPRRWGYGDIAVLPEGYAAALCFLLDEQGKPTGNEMLYGNTALLDLGAFTANAFLMVNGKFDTSELEKSSYADAGGIAFIQEPLWKWVKQVPGELQAVTPDDIDRVLRAGSVQTEDPYLLTFGRAQVDLKDELERLSEAYALWLATNIIQTQFSGLEGINRLLVVGGNADYVTKYLARKDWYGEKVVTADQWRKVTGAKFHPADYNSIGAYRAALAREARKG